MTKYIFIGLLFPFLALTSFAQKKTWDIGIIAGLSNYQGDLIKEDFSLKALHPSFGIEANYNIDRIFSIRPMFFYGRFSGSDFFYEDRKGRGYSSETSFVELATSLQINPLQLFLKKNFRFVPKFFIGGGIMSYDVNTWNVPSNISTGMNHKILNGSFHFGANVFYPFNERYSIGYEMSHRSLFNDKIDGVSIGNPNSYDWYYLTNLIFSVKF